MPMFCVLCRNGLPKAHGLLGRGTGGTHTEATDHTRPNYQAHGGDPGHSPAARSWEAREEQHRPNGRAKGNDFMKGRMHYCPGPHGATNAGRNVTRGRGGDLNSREGGREGVQKRGSGPS